MSDLGNLVSRLFVPPPMPKINMGWGADMIGATGVLKQAWEMCYFKGVQEGFTYGVIVALAIAFIVHIKYASPGKGVTNVISK